MTKINVKGIIIGVTKINDTDYISITDMIRAKDGDFFVSDWLRNRNTLEFIEIWEKIYNENFNYGEFATIKSKAGLNNFKISVKELVEKTNIISLKSNPGRYGGTYAHKDIAFEFGMWISAEFKIYLIKEFQKLKEQEIKNKNLEWNVTRYISKINYEIHTDAIKSNLIPKELTKEEINKIYADEADILNLALFGITANEWKQQNIKKQGNIRDYANISQLICLSNLENINALLIEEKIPQSQRLLRLNQIAIHQMKLLIQKDMNNLISLKN
ncbi:MAG: KilA-N domain-containing protein [Candidatus Woesearchaeota archaeon]